MNNYSLAQFLVLFDVQSRAVSEQFNELRLVFQNAAYKPISVSAFDEAIKFLNSRDNLQLSVIIEGGDPIDYYSGNDTTDFIADYESRMSVVEDETIEIILKITKNIINGVISVYSYNDFLIFLKGMSLQAVFHEIHSYLKKEKFLIFEFQTEEQLLKTNSIWFVNKGYLETPLTLNRQEILDKGKTACNYNLLSKFSLIAEDFFIIESNENGLSELFNRIAIFLSIVFLYDISNLQNNTLDFRLNGYKSMSGAIDASLITVDSEKQYFHIYKWVYDSGNFLDKIGLARNIISLHLEKPGQVELNGIPLLSIQSSYKVYEKQNIKQYIEIRNKISDQLLNFHDRANKIIENFASGFQRSTFALISFYISAIILKVVSKNKLVDIFTIDTAILSTCFIICSALYYFVQKWEVNAQRLRFENNYFDVKERYTDLLDVQDIDRILNKDHEFNSDLNFIKVKAKNYSILWFTFLGIFFIATWVLYFIYNPIVVQGLFNNNCPNYCY